MSVGYTLMVLQLLIACVCGVLVVKWMSKGKDDYDVLLEELSNRNDV